MRDTIWYAVELLKVSKDKRAQVYQEQGGHTHPHNEKVRGAEQHAGSYEEGSAQEGLMNLPPIKDHVLTVC